MCILTDIFIVVALYEISAIVNGILTLFKGMKLISYHSCKRFGMFHLSKLHANLLETRDADSLFLDILTSAKSEQMI